MRRWKRRFRRWGKRYGCAGVTAGARVTVTAGALRLPALRLPQWALMICRVGKRSAPTTPQNPSQPEELTTRR
ncbi:hypothetical protein FZI41_15995 [Cronobacter sakazakii]|nr:hypothetical protein FZI41_15995 [Cronobacter sakazakii]